MTTPAESTAWPRRMALQIAFAGLANYPILPATCVPVGKDPDGLPIGVQVIADRGATMRRSRWPAGARTDGRDEARRRAACSCSPPAPAARLRRGRAEERAIRQVIADMEAAWNRGDFRGYMAGFKNPDVVFVSRGAVPARLAGHARPLHPRLWRRPGAARPAAFLRHPHRDARARRRPADQPLPARGRRPAAGRHQHPADAQGRRPLGDRAQPCQLARGGPGCVPSNRGNETTRWTFRLPLPAC